MVSELIVTASKTVEELTVVGRLKCLPPGAPSFRVAPPKVVSSFPEHGATVRPGLVVFRVTFDQPMACAGTFDEDEAFRNPCPDWTQNLLLSYDRRTIRTVCLVQPNASYGVFGHGFVSLNGHSVSGAITFRTSAGPPIANVCEALKEDAEGARQIETFRTLDCSHPDAR